MASTDPYVNLITSEHRDKPNFVAVVRALAQPFADIAEVQDGMPDDYDLDLAVGVQLDSVGLWVGAGRQVLMEITGVYFAFDIVDVGWDEGVWKGPFDPTVGLVTLDDDTYRVLIRAKIGINHWDGTMPALQAILAQVFEGTGTLGFAVDNQDMSMTVALSGATPSPAIVALFKAGRLSPKPGGVRVNYVLPSVPGTAVFGFDTNNGYIGGWDTGSWAVP